MNEEQKIDWANIQHRIALILARSGLHKGLVTSTAEDIVELVREELEL